MSHGVELLPALFTPEQARADDRACSPLFEGAPEGVPLVGLIDDGTPLSQSDVEALDTEFDEVLEEAIEDLAHQSDACWVEQDIPVKGGASLKILMRQGDGAESAEMLVPDTLLEAAEILGADALAVAVPVHGALLVTDAGQKWQLVAAFAAAARMQHAGGGESALYAGVIRAEAGILTGVIELRTASFDAQSTNSGPGQPSSRGR